MCVLRSQARDLEATLKQERRAHKEETEALVAAFQEEDEALQGALQLVLGEDIAHLAPKDLANKLQDELEQKAVRSRPYPGPALSACPVGRMLVRRESRESSLTPSQ